VIRYSVSLSRTARKYLERCGAPTRDRLRRKLEKLKADFFDPKNSNLAVGHIDEAVG
jgi:mRNA-degrading endonuclease RelE of RelBE toxin-antitoxin system